MEVDLPGATNPAKICTPYDEHSVCSATICAKLRSSLYQRNRRPRKFPFRHRASFTFQGARQEQGSHCADDFQTHCDVLIIGGGGVGSSIAYWLKEKARDGLNVVVVEKDDTVVK